MGLIDRSSWGKTSGAGKDDEMLAGSVRGQDLVIPRGVASAKRCRAEGRRKCVSMAWVLDAKFSVLCSHLDMVVEFETGDRNPEVNA